MVSTMRATELALTTAEVTSSIVDNALLNQVAVLTGAAQLLTVGQVGGLGYHHCTVKTSQRFLRSSNAGLDQCVGNRQPPVFCSSLNSPAYSRKVSGIP